MTNSVTLTKTDMKVVNTIDQLFWENGEAPSVEKVAEELGLSSSSVEHSLQKELVRKAVTGRGVPLSSTSGTDPGTRILSGQQLILINMLLNPHDVRSTREKLEEVGISTQQFAAWQRDPNFQNYFRKRVEQQFNAADSQAYLSVVRNVEHGDLNSIKFFMELRGLYTPATKVNHSFDVTSFMATLLDILQRFLADQPEVLLRISDALESQLLSVTPGPPRIAALPAETHQLLSPDFDMSSVDLPVGDTPNSPL